MLKFDTIDGYTYNFKNAIVTDVEVEMVYDDPLIRSYKITAHDGSLHSVDIEQTKQETNPLIKMLRLLFGKMDRLLR